MYTADNYFWGLVAYYVGALIAVWYVYWLLARVPCRHVRHIVGLLFVAILMTPVQAYPDPQLPQLAPAFLVYLFEGLVLENQQEPARALVSIFFVYLALIAGYGGWLWWRFRHRATIPLEPPTPEANEEVQDMEQSKAM